MQQSYIYFDKFTLTFYKNLNCRCVNNKLIIVNYKKNWLKKYTFNKQKNN